MVFEASKQIQSKSSMSCRILEELQLAEMLENTISSETIFDEPEGSELWKSAVRNDVIIRDVRPNHSTHAFMVIVYL